MKPYLSLLWTCRTLLLITSVVIYSRYCSAGPFSSLSDTLKIQYDSSFIRDFHADLVTRFYGSRKYTTYSLAQRNNKEKLNYRPNSPLNMGVGFNYQIIGINLGFNLPFINTTTQYGKTRFLDLQSHFYGRKLIIDFFLQRYKGYYLNDPSVLNSTPPVYVRPDLLTLNFGLQTQYLLNSRKFSFRGAFLQNERQLKSAGSGIVGASVAHTRIHADSSIIPGDIRNTDFFNNINFNDNSIGSASLNLGYGYTLIVAREWFATMAASLGYGIHFSTISNREISHSSGWGDQISGTIRLGMGYNSDLFFAGIHYIGTLSRTTTPIRHTYQELGAGNFRFSVAYRFFLRKKLFGFY